MQVLNTGKIVSPLVQVFVRDRSGVNTILFNQWVFCSFGPVYVEFRLEQTVNG
jgi:hypothetical protein